MSYVGNFIHKNIRAQRPILTLTPGAKLSPRGEFCPLGVKLSPGGELLSVHPSILLNRREWTKWGTFHLPRGQISTLGAKFNPRGEVSPWGPGVKLRMALSSQDVGKSVRKMAFYSNDLCWEDDDHPAHVDLDRAQVSSAERVAV
jgi:hypothetical protein